MAVAFADEGKAEKVEGLRFAKPTLSASIRRNVAEFDQIAFGGSRPAATGDQ